MLSSAYRQATSISETQAGPARIADPDNALLWHMNLRRLEAEALRDAVLQAAGQLNPELGGPPLLTQARADGLITVAPSEPERNQNRRSIYLLARRTYPLTFLGLFDFPIIDTNCTRRVPSVTPLQALTLMNDSFMVESSARVAENALRLAGASAAESRIVESAYLLTLSRRPDPGELMLASDHLKKQRELFSRANVAPPEAERAALASFAHVLLSTNEFLYIN